MHAARLAKHMPPKSLAHSPYECTIPLNNNRIPMQKPMLALGPHSLFLMCQYAVSSITSNTAKLQACTTSKTIHLTSHGGTSVPRVRHNLLLSNLKPATASCTDAHTIPLDWLGHHVPHANRWRKTSRPPPQEALTRPTPESTTDSKNV